MKQISNLIKVSTPTSFDIEGDKILFDKIVIDQKKYAGELRPAENWDLDIGGHEGGKYFESKGKDESFRSMKYNDNVYKEKFSTMTKMMRSWVGCVGLENINEEVICDYLSFLKKIDHLNILPIYFDLYGQMTEPAKNLMITDLGSIIDVNVITEFLGTSLEHCNILEVGGGYGRLTESFFSLYGKEQISSVLIDAVPVSLMYSYKFIRKTFPDLRVGFYYNEDPFDLDKFDCYIMPAWHFDASKYSNFFDCCINIQSMQEMRQFHVDYYLNMFDEIIKNKSGIVYISNEKDYIFQGKWNYPASWQNIFKSRTPRSWTRNSPTEVFIKTDEALPISNMMLDATYEIQLDDFDRIKNLTSLK